MYLYNSIQYVSMELNLNSRFDVVSELNTPYTLVSHSEVELTGDNGLYKAVIAESKDGKRILFSGRALLNGFANLEKMVGNPYRVPVVIELAEASTKNDSTRVYRYISKSYTVE